MAWFRRRQTRASDGNGKSNLGGDCSTREETVWGVDCYLVLTSWPRRKLLKKLAEHLRNSTTKTEKLNTFAVVLSYQITIVIHF